MLKQHYTIHRHLLWKSSVTNICTAIISSFLSLLWLFFLLCILSLPLPSLPACLSNWRTRSRSTPVPAQEGASWKRRCTMKTLTYMRTCLLPSWPLAVFPSWTLLPLLPIPTKLLFLKFPLSSSLLILKLKPLLRWLTLSSLQLTLVLLYTLSIYQSIIHIYLFFSTLHSII